MENKTFEIITGRIGPILKTKGFSESKPERGDGDSLTMTYIGEDRALRVFWNSPEQKYLLQSANIVDGAPEDEWQELSLWLFDPQTHGEADAKTIANDFEDTVNDLYRKAMKIEKRSDIRKNKANDIKGFVKKFVVLYPQYEDALSVHMTHYNELLPDTFIEEIIGGYMLEMLRQRKNAQLKKLFDLFSETYENGDVQVRSAVTVTLFRSLIKDENLNELAISYMNDGLKRSWNQMEKILRKEGAKLPV